MIASPNELLYFLELSKTLNFSRASERIGISQPSLSSAIKRLENSLGVELFIRNKHKVILTQAGKNFISHAKQLLQLWDTLKASCLASEHEVQGSITLGCHISIGHSFLPKFLPALLTTYPKLEIHLKHDLSRKIAEEIINFTIDVGIVVNPIKHPDLIIKPLTYDEVTCWQSTSLKNSSLDEKTIICDPELAQTQWLLKKIHQKGIKYKRIISTNNLEMAASLAAEGAGVGIVPASVVKRLNISSLSVVPAIPAFKDEICLIYRHENRHIKAMQVVVDAIKKCEV